MKNNKLWIMAAGTLAAFGIIAAGDNKMARLASQVKANVQQLRFIDTIGIPFSSAWKARIALKISVFNPTDVRFPLTLDSIIPIIGGQPVAGYLSQSKDLIIDPGYNYFPDLVFEIPLNPQNIALIQSLDNPEVEIKARIYQLPISFTYKFDS